MLIQRFEHPPGFTLIDATILAILDILLDLIPKLLHLEAVGELLSGLVDPKTVVFAQLQVKPLF